MFQKLALTLATCSVVSVGCMADDPTASHDVELSTGPSSGLLAFVNDHENTSLERLDDDCAIRSDSAKNIIRHRDGHDKLPGTADDDPFNTVDELDDVRMVGPWTMKRLTNCAWLFGYMRGAGPTLTGSGSAVVDGTMAPGEWDGAASMTVQVATSDNTSVSGTLHVMTDDTRMYMALEVDADITDRMFRLTVLFDDNGDGFADPGEDFIGAVWSPYSGATQFADAHVYARATRAGDTIASSVYDSSYGGSSDGAAATHSSNGVTVLELWHPLDSGDDKDLSVAAASATPFSFGIGVLNSEWIETRDWANLGVAESSGSTTETVPWTLPQNLLDELATIADGYKEPVAFPMELAEQTATLVDGVPVSYQVRFVQMLDPEGGIQLWVEFELDANLNIVSENAYI